MRKRFAALGVALVLCSGPPATAVDYRHDEETAAEAADEPGSPLGLGLGRRRERLAARRAWLQGQPPFLRDARAVLGSRVYGFERLDPSGSRKETWAAGLRLELESGRWADRLAVGATLHTAQKLYGPRDRDGLRMLRPRQTGITTLGEAWLDWRIDEQTSLRLYRQSLDLPYLNRQDSRMVPNTFEAYLVNRLADDVGFVFGHVPRMKPRDRRQFISMAEAAGVELERGVSLAGFKWEPVEGVTLGGLDLYAWDLMNVGYAELELTHPITDELGLDLAAQFTHQTSVGDAKLGAGSFSTHQLGLRAKVRYKGGSFALAYGSTGHGAAIRNPWGGSPGFLSMMRKDFDRAGEQAWGVTVACDLERLGAPGWSGFARFARGRSAEDAATGRSLPRRWELDLTLDYRPEDGPLLGFWLRLRYATLHDQGATRTGRDVRLILNYELPLL